jgi:hypothetical protein
VAGLRKMRDRGLLKVDWQFTLAMAAYDLVRLPKLLAEPVPLSAAPCFCWRPFGPTAKRPRPRMQSLRKPQRAEITIFQHPATDYDPSRKSTKRTIPPSSPCSNAARASLTVRQKTPRPNSP